MNTILPWAITTVEETKAFIKALHDNGERFHFDDDVHEIDCNWSFPERTQLNVLRQQLFNFEGFDPHEYALHLDPDYQYFETAEEEEEAKRNGTYKD